MSAGLTPRVDDDVVELCRDLIRIDSSNPTSNERAAAEWTAERLSDCGLSPQLLESAPGRASVVARWAGADYSVVLYRGYSSDFRLIVASPRLEALARTADVQATRLDDREAPQREIARQKKETEDVRATQEKSRVANKAAFRP